MDALARFNRTRRLEAEPGAAARFRAEAEGWREQRPRREREPVHPLARHQAKLERAERECGMLDLMRLM